ncbi:uncharacterized protein RBU57_014526 isoform 3-T4 [Macrochelys suwanniensis]
MQLPCAGVILLLPGETRTRCFLVTQRKDFPGERLTWNRCPTRLWGGGRTMRIFPILAWMFFPGCWAVTGPGAVRGPPGGSVAVPCRYEKGYERNPKFWCRKGGPLHCSNGHMVETDGSEAEVTRGRVSIRDNHPQREFTVTVGNLTPADAGTYQCGVHRTGLLDPRDTVELSVSPADSPKGPPERSSSETVQPASSSPKKPTSIWTTGEKGKPSISINQDTTSPVDPNPDIPLHILIPCVLLVLILFLLAAVMLVRVSKRRKKAALNSGMLNPTHPNSPSTSGSELDSKSCQFHTIYSWSLVLLKVPVLLCIVCTGIWMNIHYKQSSREMQPTDVARTDTSFYTTG